MKQPLVTIQTELRSTNIEIRIKKQRTLDRSGIFEVLERWCSLEGRTPSSALKQLLENRTEYERFACYLRDLRNPGRETT
jgi:hypothetical protein